MTMPNAPLVNVGRFDEIEATGAASDFVAWMEQQRQHGPDLLLDRLDIEPGSRVLDLGCGPGVDLAETARLSRSQQSRSTDASAAQS